LSIKAKQVAGVTMMVVVIVAILSAYHLSKLSNLLLRETGDRAELLSKLVFDRAREVVGQGPKDPYEALRQDGGIRSLLQATIGYSDHVTYAAIVDPQGVAVAHAIPSREGMPIPPQENFQDVLDGGPLAQFNAVYSDRVFALTQPLLAGDATFGSIRIGVSPLLVRSELREEMGTALLAVLAAIGASFLVSLLLAQWMLRPIHVIQSGLRRLGKGELDVRLDLPEQEFKDLGNSFEAVSQQLAALGKGTPPADDEGTLRPGEGADYQTVMESLEDAVALYSTKGEVIFSNAAMRALDIGELPESHPARQLVERTLSTRKSAGPLSLAIPKPGFEGMSSTDSGIFNGPPPLGVLKAGEMDPDSERMLMCHAIEDTNHRFLGAMLVARNVGYLNQVHSTLNYSKKAAALGRLLAGVAHEVKNPLNAMTIHLELLKQKLGSIREPIVVPAAGGGPGKVLDLSKHVTIISSEIKRLDEVVAGFLKFARPEELKLQPIRLTQVLNDVVMTIGPEAHRRRVTIRDECPLVLPEINADQGMLMQAVLNLAINALQAMPEGGTLRLGCRVTSRRRVELFVEDTGIGIDPENLPRIFDLYFTTKEKGSGIGLSMVFRIVQLHDGEVEVQSTPGRGTKFRLMFPQA
jgi:signal transduction histidine kinase